MSVLFVLVCGIGTLNSMFLACYLWVHPRGERALNRFLAALLLTFAFRVSKAVAVFFVSEMHPVFELLWIGVLGATGLIALLYVGRLAGAPNAHAVCTPEAHLPVPHFSVIMRAMFPVLFRLGSFSVQTYTALIDLGLAVGLGSSETAGLDAFLHEYELSSREGVVLMCLAEALLRQAFTVMENAWLYRQIIRMSTTDGLTGLTNVRSFRETLKREHARAARHRLRYSIVMMDIDHFKKINDVYGHPVGDTVLREMAALLAGQCRDTDLPARYGGEEFVVLLPKTPGDGAALMAERVRQATG